MKVHIIIFFINLLPKTHTLDLLTTLGFFFVVFFLPIHLCKFGLCYICYFLFFETYGGTWQTQLEFFAALFRPNN